MMPTQKNNRILLGVLSLFIALTPSLAKTEAYKTYVGFDLSYTDHSDYYMAGKFPGFGLYLGGRSESFGLELGLNKKTNVFTFSSNLDALFYYPLNTEKTFETLGLLGFSWNSRVGQFTGISASFGTGSSSIQTGQEFGNIELRFGTGIQYKLIDNLSLRTTLSSGIKIFGDENARPSFPSAPPTPDPSTNGDLGLSSTSIDKNNNYIPTHYALSLGLLYAF